MYRAFKIHDAFILQTGHNDAYNPLSIIVQLKQQLSKCGPGKLGGSPYAVGGL